MKTKKNAGFSLVELIVVIAIMAVLVGVLAPAYLRYVEKSRKSADISAMSDIISAANNVATDVEYNLGTNAKFMVSVNNGSVTLTVSDDDANEATKAENGWKDVSNCKNGYTCKSKEFKSGTGGAVGFVQANGTVEWPYSGVSGTVGSMCAYSRDFCGKFSF